jgi:hypothetical protein
MPKSTTTKSNTRMSAVFATPLLPKSAEAEFVSRTLWTFVRTPTHLMELKDLRAQFSRIS